MPSESQSDGWPRSPLRLSARSDLLDLRLHALCTGPHRYRGSGHLECQTGLHFSICELGVLHTNISTVCAQQAVGNEKI